VSDLSLISGELRFKEGNQEKDTSSAQFYFNILLTGN
jgi:hypothetical protein